MPIPIAGHPYLDSLEVRSVDHKGVTEDPDLADYLLYALLRLGFGGPNNPERAGFAISSAVGSPDITAITVYYADPVFLRRLKYPNLAAFQAAVDANNLFHPEDVYIGFTHISVGMSAPFRARFRLGDGSGNYKMLSVQGLRFPSKTAMPPLDLILHWEPALP